MKEILFRAKAINRDPDKEYRTNYKNGDWVYGFVTKLYNAEYNSPAEMKNTDGVGGIEVDCNTIGQFTGLRDKNGTMIFEGDIVKKRTGYGMKNLPVTFSFGCFHCGFGGGSSTATHPYTLDDRQIEVKGNIYDNPELIKEGS